MPPSELKPHEEKIQLLADAKSSDFRLHQNELDDRISAARELCERLASLPGAVEAK